MHTERQHEILVPPTEHPWIDSSGNMKQSKYIQANVLNYLES